MKPIRRARSVMYIMALLVPVLSIVTSPDFGWITDMKYGAEITTFLIYLSRALVAGVLLHVFRKLLNDYPTARLDKLLEVANNNPTGAGLAVVGIALLTIAYALVISAILISS